MALEWDTVQKILIVVSILSFGVAILGAVGEYLGWWDAIGEVLMTTGTVVGALTGLAGLVGSASQRTVEAIHATVEDNKELLQESNTKLQRLDRLETLDDVQYELDRQTGVLQDIRDRM